MARQALIKNGEVFNLVLWDGPNLENPELDPDWGSDVEAVELDDDSPVGIGWTYVEGKFIAPPLPEPTPEDILAQNTQLYTSLNRTASNRISILTDATDPDIMGDDINPDDVVLLKEWKKYRVLLSRVDLTVKEPDWPVAPE